MKLNIQWKKVLYGIALILIGIILVALHFIVVGNGIGYFISGICLLILRVFLIWIFEKCLDWEKKRKRKPLDFLPVLLTEAILK